MDLDPVTEGAGAIIHATDAAAAVVPDLLAHETLPDEGDSGDHLPPPVPHNTFIISEESEAPTALLLEDAYVTADADPDLAAADPAPPGPPEEDPFALGAAALSPVSNSIKFYHGM